MPAGATCIHEEKNNTCLVIVGGVHGNEPAGARAIATVTELVRSGDWHVSGSVYGLIGNPRAGEKNIRFIDENLNRAFNGNTLPHSYETKRAHEIITWMQVLIDSHTHVYVLDLHSVSLGDTRILVWNATNKNSETWGRAVSPIPYRLTDTDCIVPDTLIGACEKLGATAVTVECGNHTAPTAETVALEHIERALESLHMLSGKHTSYQNKVSYEGPERTYHLFQKIVPREGFVFSIPVASEMFLAAGTEYARDNVGAHTAPCDCYIMMPAKHPDPKDTDAGFLALLQS